MLVSLAVLAQEEEAFGSHVWNRSPSALPIYIHPYILGPGEYTGCPYISRAPAFQPDSLTFDNKIETILQLSQK